MFSNSHDHLAECIVSEMRLLTFTAQIIEIYIHMSTFMSQKIRVKHKIQYKYYPRNVVLHSLFSSKCPWSHEGKSNDARKDNPEIESLRNSANGLLSPICYESH